MTDMAQIEIAMFEPGTAKTKNLPSLIKQERPKRECRTRKRPYDVEQYASKRLKYDQLDPDDQIENSCTFGLATSDTDEDNDTESKCSTSDETEQSSIKQFDDNSDLEEIEEDNNNVHFTKVASDQQRHIPVVFNQTIIQQQQTLTRHSKRLISQFKYLYNHGLRKSIQPTHPPDDTSTFNQDILRWELRNTFNRIDLFKEGYCILSNEPFPFYCLCYLCGSMGSDLIYCTSCCEPYHPNCLNEYERPRLTNSFDEHWLCPNCNVCSICGILTNENLLSRMNSDLNLSSQLISCYDCQRNFHLKCLKRLQDHELPSSTANSIILLSRLSHSYLYNQTWSCPSCIKCDCGEDLKSNERNILSLNKTFAAQQALMCSDCFDRFEILHREKNELIDQCHFCEKYLEQILFKTSHRNSLLQCIKCKHRFHSKCDGYFTEDVQILPRIQSLALNIICSKCDLDEREKIRKSLRDYKIQTMKTIQSNIFSTFQLIITDDNQLTQMEKYLTHLQQFHESHPQIFNLQQYLNDFLAIIQHLFSSHDLQRWQSVLHGCILRQCPWFKSSMVLSNPSIHSQPVPSIDHTYAMNNDLVVHQPSADSLLNYLENYANNASNSFVNLHQIDTRKCQLCQSLSDHSSIHIGRLISFGINQWVHVGCILAAYAKNLDQPPYILRNIRETIIRCQTKYICVLCSKLGASVHCYENECYQRFHSHCIQKYYSTIDKTHQTPLNLKNGFLPNLTTLCLKHNGTKTMNNHNHRESTEGTNEDESKDNLNNDAGPALPKIKCVNTSSTVYGDLSNNLVEFALSNARLCIGSLQIQSLGNFDYQIDPIDENLLPDMNYPNDYHASRLFWSMKNPREKTVYHLHIQIEQTYHTNPCNHQVIEHPINPIQIHQEQLYEQCRKEFEKLQKKIDEHLANIEEFCQKTMVNKKGMANQSQSRRKNATPGTATTKRLTKGMPSCVKRQTPKAALKNVSRPRNRFANEKNSQIPLANKSFNPPKENIPTVDIQNLFSNDYLKSTNVSQFALALVQALRQVGQSTKMQQEPNLNFYPTSSSSNGSTTDKNNDILLKQLLKNIATPQQSHDSQISTISSAQWRPIISTQTDVPKNYDELKLNGHPSYSYPSPTTDNSSNLFPKPTSIPQLDGSIDEHDDREICSTVINTLLEQIHQTNPSDRFRTDSEYSMDLSDYVSSPALIGFTPISPNNRSSIEKKKKKKYISSFEVIQLYRQWLKTNFCRVKFTITNDEGYRVISEDLDSAWSDIITSIRNTREELKFQSLPMTKEESSGHRIFGLTKPILKTMFKQMSTNEPQIGNILLPLSIPSTMTNLSSTSDENFSRKTSSNIARVRSNVYERKTRERQRFGWLLNQSRKIEYALKSFEIDNALFHARKILLEEASVSLRLYHLHYFSERALLVGSSPIHGCGLFTLVDLVEGQMIIEYTGEVVRPCLTDKRERENEGKGFGCYMFTVDSMNVIDATHRGNKARFINHNCQPNCFAKTVLSGGAKHIVIYALIDIARGSELTYDYSFPEEDVKIPCHCGTTKCRIYLN